MSASSASRIVAIALLSAACTGEGPPRPTGSAPFPMPNPPSSGLPHPQSYLTTEEGGLVLDQVTGLAWQRNIDEGPGETGGFVWQDAVDHCDALVLEGYDDFRLPTRVELVSIVDPSVTNPAIDHEAFPDAPAEAFVSSSLAPGVAESAFSVSFLLGETSTSATTDELRVRCVRNDRQAALPKDDERFRIDGGAVIDRMTGLMWERTPRFPAASFAEARAYCSDLVVNGRPEFRSPSMKELQTLVDEARSDPCIDPDAFPEASGSAYWSSTFRADDHVSGWLVSFADGTAALAGVGAVHLVRCVR
jgi:hypothetical protein